MGECIKFVRGKILLYKPNFADNSWEKIISACQKGDIPETWKVGDQKTMTIGGTDYLIDIIGKNHDVYSDGSGTAPLTFQMHDCYATKYKMGNSDDNTAGWTNCLIRTTNLPAILALMPSEVVNGVREVDKKTSAGGRSSTINTTADKLFLLSEYEVFGTLVRSYSGEGIQYAYYAAGNSKVKGINGSNQTWQLRSPATSTYYCHVSNTGGAGSYKATSSYGVAFAFCF